MVPCYLGYALFIARWPGQNPAPGVCTLAVFFSTLIGMVSGAAMVPVEVTLSGVAAVPFAKFMGVMVSLHLLVAPGRGDHHLPGRGLSGQGPAGVAGRRRGEADPGRGAGSSNRAVVGSMLVIALLLGAVVSNFASNWSDALESVTAHEEAGDAALVKDDADPLHGQSQRVAEHARALLPDYEWTSLSGTIGTIVTLLIVWLIGISLRRNRKKPAAGAGPPLNRGTAAQTCAGPNPFWGLKDQDSHLVGGECGKDFVGEAARKGFRAELTWQGGETRR